MNKTLTLYFADGTSETYPVPADVAQEAVNAHTNQLPAHPLYVDDATLDFINFRQVTRLRLADDEAPTPAVSESETEDTRTVAELKAALDTAGVDYDSKALKAELLELARANGA